MIEIISSQHWLYIFYFEHVHLEKPTRIIFRIVFQKVHFCFREAKLGKKIDTKVVAMAYCMEVELKNMT